MTDRTNDPRYEKPAMTTPEKLEELADDFLQQSVDGHFGNGPACLQFEQKLRRLAVEAAQSARIPEGDGQVVELRRNAEIVYLAADAEVARTLSAIFTKAADTIETQAREIVRLKGNESDMMAEHSEAMTKAALRAEAAEARIVELTRERDEARAARDAQEDLTIKMAGEAEGFAFDLGEARAQVTALTAENAALREALKDQHEWCVMEAQNIGAVDGYDYSSGEEHGLSRAADHAKKALSTPNPKAMRMVEVVKAAERIAELYDLTFNEFEEGRALKSALAALTDGEQG